MKKSPRRQVHLDFRTSPDITGIGSRFDKAQFQTALKAGHASVAERGRSCTTN